MIKSKNSIILILFLSFILSNTSKAYENRVVRINADVINDIVSTGTGFFWEINGNVLTAYHVVQGAKEIRIYYKGKMYDQIEVISYSNEYDLVLLKIKNFHDHHEIKYYQDKYFDFFCLMINNILI